MSETFPIQRPATVEVLSQLLDNGMKQGRACRIVGSNSMPLTHFSRAAQSISTTRLNKVLEHAVADMTVIVQAGITLEALQKELAWRNQWIPVDPPVIATQGRSPGMRTLGGLIASNSLGPLRFSMGDWRLLVLGMKWANAAGHIIKGGGRTVKNVAGYGIPRLMVGSCGSLGIITEVTLRAYARPADERALVVYSPGAAETEKMLGDILVAPVNPAYLQVIGRSAFESNPLGLPAMETGAVIVVGFLGRPEVCAAQVEIARKRCESTAADAISLTAAQSGRLRLWMAGEPPVQPPGAGFRMHVKSSQVAAAIEQMEASTRKPWLVSEAASGLIRGTIAGPGLEAQLEQLADALQCTISFSQGVARGPRRDALYMRAKRALDPDAIFGDALE
jgi:glycolate oxidase FAD binding subunit